MMDCPFLQKESFQIGQPAWLARVFVEIFVDFFLRSRVLLACGCLFLHSQDVFFFRKDPPIPSMFVIFTLDLPTFT